MHTPAFRSFRLLLATSCAALTVFASLNAQAQANPAATFPSRPIHFVVDYPPGGVPDIIVRTIGQKVSENTGQPVIIENRPGAGGQVAIDYVGSSPPDGYTLMLGQTGSYAIAPHLLKRSDLFEKNLTPVALAGSAPIFLVVNSNLNITTVKELIAYAKAKPGMSYGSSGNGSGHHLAMELFKSLTQTEMTHVPYKGAPQSTLAVSSGEVDIAFLGLNSADPQAKAGKIRILGVAEPQRNAFLPDVPTIAEAGVPGYSLTITLGFFAPIGTPPAVINKLNAEIGKAVVMPEVRQKLAPMGINAADGTVTPKQYGEVVKTEYAAFGKVVRSANLKVD